MRRPQYTLGRMMAWTAGAAVLLALLRDPLLLLLIGGTVVVLSYAYLAYLGVRFFLRATIGTPPEPPDDEIL